MNKLIFLPFLVLTLLLAGCETPIVTQSAQDRAAISSAISKEAPGNYFIGYRFYKVDYKMWGWVKKPGESWKNSQLVMFNEQKMLAPDRAKNAIGSDNNTIYRLSGYFSGEKVYEPASDTVYPEFVLTGASVISTNSPLIFPDQRWTDPSIRLIAPPQF
jgi:hypothetical protein